MTHPDSRRSRPLACAAARPVWRPWAAGLLALLCGLVLAGTARPALLRPWEGAGNFHSMVDVVNRWRPDGTLDVILLFSVANSDLSFEEDGSLTGKLLVQAILEGRDGGVVQGEREIVVRTSSRQEAVSNTLYQVFPVVLENVTAESGRLTCRLEDLNRQRPGLLNAIKKRFARSETVGDWEAPRREPDPAGLSLSDPYFLVNAPIGLWREEDPLAKQVDDAALLNHLHPNRRYGLEQDHLQIYFEVEPPAGGGGGEAAASGLFLQILAKDLEFAMRDTIPFSDRDRRRLEAGGRTGVFYELDVNLLPAGAYQLSCGPANGRGRGWLAEFDVIWRLAGIARHRDELEGEGRTIFFGDQLDAFLAAGQAEREVALERFWTALDPTPDTEANEVYLEFRQRVEHVRQRMGGFGRLGAKDARGRIFLLLGAPDEVQRENMPLNPSEMEDAFVKVFDRFAPDRPGTEAKGANTEGAEWMTGITKNKSGVPSEPGRQALREISSRRQTVEREKAFELWRYNHAGRQLFPNVYTSQNLGLSFLFVDRTGTGTYVLETSNARRSGS